MDTSPEYIKMCEQADEIQALAPEESYTDRVDYEASFSSLFYLPKEETLALLHYDNDERRWMIGEYRQDTEGSIWLPRQDQLQEMVGDYLTCISALNRMVFNLFGSMEQPWLAFVMKEKFQKIWDNVKGEWVEVK